MIFVPSSSPDGEREEKVLASSAPFFCCGRKVKGKVECGVAEKRKKERQKTFLLRPLPFKQAQVVSERIFPPSPPPTPKSQRRVPGFQHGTGFSTQKRGKNALTIFQKDTVTEETFAKQKLNYKMWGMLGFLAAERGSCKSELSAPVFGGQGRFVVSPVGRRRSLKRVRLRFP